jgi:hypothetical protein
MRGESVASASKVKTNDLIIANSFNMLIVPLFCSSAELCLFIFALFGSLIH